MKILVTGGAGFIGSNIVDALIEKDHEVAIVDNLSTGLKENINQKAKFYEGDITSREILEEIFEKFSPEAIFHLAAQINVRHSVEDPLKDIKVNVIGTVNLLTLAEEYEVKKFIYSSTGGAIYGDDVERPTPETAEERPISPYGMDKLSAERFIEYFKGRNPSLKTICLRYANVYGPRQNPHGEAGVISIFTPKMLKEEPIEVWGDGEQTRDYVYVGDVVAVNLAALEFDGSGTYNIGTGVETSVNKLAEIVQAATDSQSEVKHVEAKEGEQKASSLSYQKAYQDLGWKPEVEFEEGVKRTVEWYRNRSNK
ncbi:MAG: SDR family NAD(P)-dependent oxidoreductase [Candidatus Berkelbacteria bacterium]|nr:SDR family NAD(P)-dependent oxidoreductase [Candidatus Berkelbacteria bacterium]